MPRYIDADELIKKIFPYDGVDKKEYSINAQAVYNAIRNMPIVTLGIQEGEIKPIKTGKKMRPNCDNCKHIHSDICLTCVSTYNRLTSTSTTPSNWEAIPDEQKYFLTPSDVAKMSPQEVKENYDLIIESMREWNK